MKAIQPIQLRSTASLPDRWWNLFVGDVNISRYRIGFPAHYDSPVEPNDELARTYPQSVTFKRFGVRLFDINVYQPDPNIYECDICPSVFGMLFRKWLDRATEKMRSLGFVEAE